MSRDRERLVPPRGVPGSEPVSDTRLCQKAGGRPFQGTVSGAGTVDEGPREGESVQQEGSESRPGRHLSTAGLGGGTVTRAGGLTCSSKAPQGAPQEVPPGPGRGQ